MILFLRPHSDDAAPLGMWHTPLDILPDECRYQDLQTCLDALKCLILASGSIVVIALARRTCPYLDAEDYTRRPRIQWEWASNWRLHADLLHELGFALDPKMATSRRKGPTPATDPNPGPRNAISRRLSAQFPTPTGKANLQSLKTMAASPDFNPRFLRVSTAIAPAQRPIMSSGLSLQESIYTTMSCLGLRPGYFAGRMRNCIPV